MSAGLLREAAALMRKRAEAATGSEWGHWQTADNGRVEVFVPTGSMDAPTVFEFKDHMDCEECIRPSEADASHIASWHPAVALAVADWLDLEARAQQRAQDQYPGTGFATSEQALAVARAYLGRDA
jgi:hypothetical protein